MDKRAIILLLFIISAFTVIIVLKDYSKPKFTITKDGVEVEEIERFDISYGGNRYTYNNLQKEELTIYWLNENCECSEPIKCYDYKPCDCSKYKCQDNTNQIYVVEVL